MALSQGAAGGGLAQPETQAGARDAALLCQRASRNFSRFRSMEFKPFYACPLCISCYGRMVAQPASFRLSQTWSFKNEQYAALCRVGATGRTRAAPTRCCARACRCAVVARSARAGRRGAEIVQADPDRCGRFDARLDGVRRLCRQPAAVRAGRSVRTRRPDRPDCGARRRGRPRAQAGCAFFGRRRSCQRQRLDTDEPDAGAAPVGQRHCRDLLRAAYFMENWTPMIAGCRHRRAAPSFLSPRTAHRDGGGGGGRGPGRRGVPLQEWTARDHACVRPAAPCAKGRKLARWPPNCARRCGWIRWRRTAGPGDGGAGFSPGGAGRIHRDDARPEQRAYRHGYGPRGGALGGIDPLARRGRHGAGGSRRVS